jgi:hypothetical protein
MEQNVLYPLNIFDSAWNIMSLDSRMGIRESVSTRVTRLQGRILNMNKDLYGYKLPTLISLMIISLTYLCGLALLTIKTADIFITDDRLQWMIVNVSIILR